MSYRVCPKCKYNTPKEYKHCTHCGAPLPGAVIQTEQSPGLVVMYPSGKSKKDIPFILPPSRITIGRADDNAIALDDEEVSRYHVAIYRDDESRIVIEDLNSTNGTFLNGKRIDAIVPLSRGDELWIGKSVLQVESTARFIPPGESQPRMPKEEPADSVEESPTERSVTPVGLTPVHFASYQPESRDGFTTKTVDENEYYILNRQDGSGVRKLNKRSAHMWKLMDGEHSLYDILVDYTNRFRSRGSDRLVDLVDELYEKGLLKDSPVIAPVLGADEEEEEATEGLSGYNRGRIILRGFDDWLTMLYTGMGWWFQSRVGFLYLSVLSILGFLGFFLILYHADFSLFKENNSIVLGLVVLLIAHIVVVIVHGMGQALAAKSYHRKIKQAGFKFTFGIPTFYVDVSDVWQEPKEARIRTLLGGPIACFFMGSLISLIMLACSNDGINNILFKFSAWANIIAYFSLNPLFQTAGYFALMDFVDIPKLRKRSSLYIKHIFEKKQKKEEFTRDRIVYSLYIVLCVLWFLFAARVAYAYIQILFNI